ncbi:MAG: HAD-IA family hydrolase [Alcanivoracaceae bacterium]|nr:HAD-IA family hydrolase [Alcanivoracaceae bacterium]
MKYQLVIFDWDGTLMDSTGRIVDCMQKAAADMQLPPLSAFAVQQIIGLGLPEAISTLYPALSAERVMQMRDQYASHFIAAESTPSVLFAGAQALLNTLQEKNVRIAVATGKSRKGLNRVLASSGLADYFHITRCADESGSKPDPKMLMEIVDALSVPVQDAVMIGDTSFDLEMAQRAGIDRIGVTYGAHSRDILARHQPLALCDRLDQVLMHIQQTEKELG